MHAHMPPNFLQIKSYVWIPEFCRHTQNIMRMRQLLLWNYPPFQVKISIRTQPNFTTWIPKYIHMFVIAAKFKNLIRKYLIAFWLPDTPLTIIPGNEHCNNILTGDVAPGYQLPYRKSLSELSAIKTELDCMLKLKIIEPSDSPWGSPCILVKKPAEQGKPQPPWFAVDYCRLNAITESDGYLIPSVSNILDNLSSGKYYGKMDLASGYWQIMLRKQNCPKTAFNTHLGLFQFLRLPFGLKTATSTFQRILNTIFSDFLYDSLVIYVDDVISWGNSQDEALKHYELNFKRAMDHGVQFKPGKCSVFPVSRNSGPLCN